MDAIGDLVAFLTDASSWWGRRGLLARGRSHLWLSATATAIAVAVALPPALWLGHRRRGRTLAVGVANLARAVPSFAVIALVLPFSVRAGLGLGFWPTCAALVLLGIPPVFTNTYEGVAGADPGAVEAARGMGMRPGQLLWAVEVPLAAPLILTGVRIAAVQIVATATLGALVGFQGLGSFIIEGLAQGGRGTERLLAGAVSVAVLAVVTDAVLGRLERRLTPWTSGSPPRRASAS